MIPVDHTHPGSSHTAPNALAALTAGSVHGSLIPQHADLQNEAKTTIQTTGWNMQAYNLPALLPFLLSSIPKKNFF